MSLFRGSALIRRFSSAKAQKLNDNLLDEFKRIAGQGNWSVNKEVLKQHGKDEGHFDCEPPDIVLWPESTKVVSDVARLCYSKEIPIIPFGTGTGLEGGVNAIHGGVCVDTSKMNNVLVVNAEDFDCTVEAGVTWRDLNVHLRDTGLWFPVDPGASASLGGMSSTGASGTNAVKYGTMKENILNLEVVLSDGRVVNTSGRGTRAKKSSAGYNLTELFVGSEGTLGIITKICLRLRAVPGSIVAAVSSFPDVQSAIATTIETLQSDVPVARMEFLDEVSMRACRKYSGVTFPEQPALFFEFHGYDENETQNVARRVGDICKANGGSEFESATEQEARNKLWKARHELYYACMNLSPGAPALTTDVCVPVSKLTEMVIGTRRLLDDNHLLGSILGHVGDGNIHCMLLGGHSATRGRGSDAPSNVVTVRDRLEELALSLGGTCTGEHGVGRGKVGILREQFGEEGIAAMQSLKRALDPKNILNPGKLF